MVSNTILISSATVNSKPHRKDTSLSTVQLNWSPDYIYTGEDKDGGLRS